MTSRTFPRESQLDDSASTSQGLHRGCYFASGGDNIRDQSLAFRSRRFGTFCPRSFALSLPPSAPISTRNRSIGSRVSVLDDGAFVFDALLDCDDLVVFAGSAGRADAGWGAAFSAAWVGDHVAFPASCASEWAAASAFFSANFARARVSAFKLSPVLVRSIRRNVCTTSRRASAILFR